ncbi:DUF4153 domain-containing protein [Halothermothrix orenii]|uniref:DUF4153 domain-containing protein n=1 Tax=Halothermothrix orenii (strain H 168 / OCM 544 / DSM 9562) TaxID=373903 RepID=B8D209_HALOH|nr:DUF4153 domain-containing protein [Halothermothrix orenii]ACL69236.1 hypothetical protein Hore_04780 [Halothermothrix orenii H 168]
MKKLKLFRHVLTSLTRSIKRFPLPTLFTTITTILMIILANEYLYDFDKNTVRLFSRLVMTSSLGFPLFLCINLLFRRWQGLKAGTRNLIRFTGAVALILYFFFLSKGTETVTTSRFLAFNLALYLLFLVIPYFYKRENFELYVVKLFIRVLVTIIYSVILYLGLSAIFLTINALLDIPVSHRFYLNTWLITAGIFAPVFFLGGVPEQGQKINPDDYPTFFEILLLYIVMPLITIYTGILYIYFIKILITAQWPRGLVAHLVLWYSALSTVVMFFIHPLLYKKWVKQFIKWFPVTNIPLLIMMFVSIGKRINAYGVTENRYYVVLLGLWILGIMVYYILSSKKRNIILPLSLAIIMVLAVIGPWSSFSISRYSQNKRFAAILSRYRMIRDNRIIKTDKVISENDQKEINSIISYFKNNHDLDDLNYLPEGFTTDNMEELFGFSYSGNYYESYKYFSHKTYENREPIRVSGYDYLFHLKSKDLKLHESDSDITVKYNKEDYHLLINHRGQEVYHKPLLPLFSRLHKVVKEKGEENLKPNDYTLIQENGKVKVKVIIAHISGSAHKSDPDKINIYSTDLYLLLKVK